MTWFAYGADMKVYDPNNWYEIQVEPPKNQILLLSDSNRKNCYLAASLDVIEWQNSDYESWVRMQMSDEFIPMQDITHYKIV